MSDARRVAERVREVVTPVLWALGLELVDVQCTGSGPRTILRVFIDKPDGVTLRDCEAAHLSLGPALDVADPFPHGYILEVSSPGLDRPLRRVEDYRRAVGKKVSVKLRQPYNGQWRLVGQLMQVEETSVTIVPQNSSPDGPVRLAVESIVEARLEVTF